MLFVLGIIATLAIVAGLLFILGTAMPSISNKVCRFVFLFLLFILFDLVIDYVNVWASASTRWDGRSRSLFLWRLLFTELFSSRHRPTQKRHDPPLCLTDFACGDNCP
jgi:hypothetical protein